MKHEELSSRIGEIQDSLGKEDAFLCFFKAEDGAPGMFISGLHKTLVASVAYILNADRKVRDVVRQANLIDAIYNVGFGMHDLKAAKEEEEAERLAKEYLRNNGFKMEGE